MSDSTPPVALEPERVTVACDSWDQFEHMFRRRLQSHQVFVPSVQPPPVGSQLEFLFSIPDGTSIRMPGRVISTVPPKHPSEPSSAERAGMIVEFGKFARAEEQRVRALLQSLEENEELGGLELEGVVSCPPTRSPSTPSRAPSTPSQAIIATPIRSLRPARSGSSLPAQPDQAEVAAVLQRLQTELAALRNADAANALGVDRSTDDAAIRRAYLTTSKRYHPHAFARYRSAEVRRLATEAYVLIQRAYAQLGNSPRMPQHEADARRSQRAARYEDDVAVSEAVQRMELHQYAEAIRLLVAVLNADPDKRVARLWLNLAGARHARELGELNVAADCYRVVLELQPDHPEARQQLSLLPPSRESAPQLGARPSLLERLIGRKR